MVEDAASACFAALEGGFGEDLGAVLGDDLLDCGFGEGVRVEEVAVRLGVGRGGVEREG